MSTRHVPSEGRNFNFAEVELTLGVPDHWVRVREIPAVDVFAKGRSG